MDDEAPLTLSREDLYELAWSKPMSELAKDFGISDVALAKRCRRLGIPIPGRGYWARVDAGQKPYRPKLPKRKPEWHDRGALTVAPLASPPSVESPDSQRPDDALWLNERIGFEQLPENAISVEQPPARWDPVVRTYRDKLRAEAKEVLASKAAYERYEKLPPSRRQGVWDHDGWKWRTMMSSGQRLLDHHKRRSFRVTLETLERALAITNAIATAGKARGFILRDDEQRGRLALVGHAAEMQFRVTEQLETKLRPCDWRKGETEKYQVPTGRLRITITDGWREGPILEDKGNVRLETLLDRLFIGLYKAVIKQWRDAREAKVRQERQRLEELERAEEERIRAKNERKAAAERRRRVALAAEAQRWREAVNIRSYVACVRGHATAASGMQVPNPTHEWVEWALAVADELDPTRTRRLDEEAGREQSPSERGLWRDDT